MQPGLSRAIPMAILGFLFGSLIVVVLRFLQSLDPVFEVGSGIVVSAVFTAIFFLWGMGAFDPRMSQHGEEAEEHHEEPVEDENNAPPARLLASAIWPIATLLLIFVIIVWAFALLGVFTLRTTDDPDASLTAIGYYILDIGGREILLSQLVVYLGFIIFMIASVAVIGGGIAWLFTQISHGITVGKAAAAGGSIVPVSTVPQLSAPQSGVIALSDNPNAVKINFPPILRTLIVMVVTFVVVAFLFNQVLLPMTISHAPQYIQPFTIIFAALAAIFVARPSFLPHLVHVWALILFIFGILYFIFYEVAIGMVIAQPFEVRVIASLVNAFMIAVLLVRPKWVLWFIGASVRITLTIMKALPRVLFQR